MRFAAATGTSVVRLTTDRYWRKFFNNTWTPGFVRGGDGGSRDGACYADPFETSVCEITGSAIYEFPAGTSALEFGIRCGVPAGQHCGNGASQHTAIGELHSARVTISDTGIPTVGAPGGAAWSATWLRGTPSVSYEASDATGIASARVRVDGTTALTIAGSCDRTGADYLAPRPCTDRTGGSALTGSLDLSHVPDGRHVLHLEATDPAGNSGEVTRTVDVDQTAPAAPASVATTPSRPGQAGWALTPEVGVGWTEPGGQVAPVASAYVSVCREDGTCRMTTTSASSLTPQAVAALTEGDGIYDVAISLGDAAGNGAAFDAARAATGTLRVDGTAPAAPTDIATFGRSHDGWIQPGGAGLRWTLPGGQVAPVRTASVRACRRGGGCVERSFPADLGLSADKLAPLLPGDGVYDVAVSLGDEAGNGSGATDDARAGTAVLHVDATAPAAPGGLSIGAPANDVAPFDVRWPRADGEVAPIAAVHVRTCGPAGCADQVLPGDATQATVPASEPGEHAVAVWFEDAAGNVDPARAATVTLVRAARATSPAEPSRTAPRSPGLRVREATLDRRTARLVVAGDALSGLRTTAVVRIEVRVGGRRLVRVHRLAMRSSAPGRFRVRVVLDRQETRLLMRARVVRVTVATPATAGVAAGSTTPARVRVS